MAALDRAVADLSRLPPITTSWEVDDLKREMDVFLIDNIFTLSNPR